MSFCLNMCNTFDAYIGWLWCAERSLSCENQYRRLYLTLKMFESDFYFARFSCKYFCPCRTGPDDDSSMLPADLNKIWGENTLQSSWACTSAFSDVIWCIWKRLPVSSDVKVFVLLFKCVCVIIMKSRHISHQGILLAQHELCSSPNLWKIKSSALWCITLWYATKQNDAILLFYQIAVWNTQMWFIHIYLCTYTVSLCDYDNILDMHSVNKFWGI